MIETICIVFLVIIALAFGVIFLVSNKEETELEKILRLHNEEMKNKRKRGK